MIDILGKLYRKEINIEDAQKIVDESIEDFNKDILNTWWPNEVCFSKYEATAYGQTADLIEIMNLRYIGWSEYCCVCGKPIDWRQFGWWIVHTKTDKLDLKHIQCPVNDC